MNRVLSLGSGPLVSAGKKSDKLLTNVARLHLSSLTFPYVLVFVSLTVSVILYIFFIKCALLMAHTEDVAFQIQAHFNSGSSYVALASSINLPVHKYI